MLFQLSDSQHKNREIEICGFKTQYNKMAKKTQMRHLKASGGLDDDCVLTLVDNCM